MQHDNDTTGLLFYHQHITMERRRVNVLVVHLEAKLIWMLEWKEGGGGGRGGSSSLSIKRDAHQLPLTTHLPALHRYPRTHVTSALSFRLNELCEVILLLTGQWGGGRFRWGWLPEWRLWLWDAGRSPGWFRAVNWEISAHHTVPFPAGDSQADTQTPETPLPLVLWWWEPPPFTKGDENYREELCNISNYVSKQCICN